MNRQLSSIMGALALLTAPGVALAQPAPPPPAEADLAAYAPFAPMIGKTWRGVSTAQPGIEDVQRWDWAIGGHAVRIVHSVNDGAYAGETLIFRDKDTGDFIFHYFTTGGFHTTGVITPVTRGFEIDEVVHGADGIERLRSTTELGGDGTYRVRSSTEQAGAWVEIGGFDYREDPSARILMPAIQPALEAPASAGPLDLTRRIVRGVDEPQDVAGYLRIRNGSPVADQLLRVDCACAERVELHRIQREGPNPGMAKDDVWSVPGAGQLDVRPGSDLHFMLIDFNPAQIHDGKVRLTLTFRDAGEVAAEFTVASDTREAWEAFEPGAIPADAAASPTAAVVSEPTPNHAGFAYTLPGSGWRVMDRTQTDTVETIYYERGRGGRSLQIQVSALTPMRPVASQSEVNDWARGAMSAGTSRIAEGHGAVCARAEHRWTQTLSINGAAGAPTAEIDDFGLFCAIPGSERVLHVRLFERAAPGRLSGDAPTLAEDLFASVEHRLD